MKIVNYYFITDGKSDVPVERQVELAVDKGIKMVQYRNKGASDRTKYEEAKKIKDICEGKALLMINDRVDIALGVDADGVHLGQDDFPPSKARELMKKGIIGVSTHNEEQISEAKKTADYIGIGPVSFTDTKPDKELSPTLGVDRAVSMAETLDVPTAAIGGIEEKDIPELVRGFDMICAVSSVTRQVNLEENIKRFESTCKKAKLDLKES